MPIMRGVITCMVSFDCYRDHLSTIGVILHHLGKIMKTTVKWPKTEHISPYGARRSINNRGDSGQTNIVTLLKL